MKTIKECRAAIEAIEMNPSNVIGGSAAFFSGKTTHLTAKADRRVKALEVKIEKLARDTDEDEDDE